LTEPKKGEKKKGENKGKEKAVAKKTHHNSRGAKKRKGKNRRHMDDEMRLPVEGKEQNEEERKTTWGRSKYELKSGVGG